MEKRLYGIYLIMKEVGGFKIDTLEDRIFLQKIIYLIQLLNVDFRLRFSWYIRGPYSRDLTLWAYEIDQNDELKGKADSFKIKTEVLEVIEKLKSVIDQKPTELSKASWVELLSSIHYLKWISYGNAEIGLDRIKTALQAAGKSRFTTEQVEAAWKSLEYLGLTERKHIH